MVQEPNSICDITLVGGPSYKIGVEVFGVDSESSMLYLMKKNLKNIDIRLRTGSFDRFYIVFVFPRIDYDIASDLSTRFFQLEIPNTVGVVIGNASKIDHKDVFIPHFVKSML